MSSRNKNQNSLIVLATLGVYFGLMLAGATPQVLASAAMTRQFDVKDELEFKDDLDTIPDDERSPVTDSVRVYLQDIEYFLANLADVQSRGGFDPRKDTFSIAQNTLLPCVASNFAGRYTPIRLDSSSQASRKLLEYLSREMVYGYSLGDCIDNGEFSGVSAVDSRFTVDLDRRDLSIVITVKKQSPQRASELARQLESTLRLYSVRTDSRLGQAVIRNTSFKTLKDQVLVVTRLPRAGLASLLDAS